MGGSFGLGPPNSAVYGSVLIVPEPETTCLEDKICATRQVPILLGSG